MGEKSLIEWCDSTVNLWIGCTEVSAACDHCYARELAKRFKIKWNAPPIRTKANSWDKIALYQRTARKFLAAHGRPRIVFINSMSDFFDNQAEQAWRDDGCREMEAAPNVIFILVTKRPQNIHRMVPMHWMRPDGWPENIWLVTTTENQLEYDRRVRFLLSVPAAVRGVSMEPMLEPIVPWAHLARVDMVREYNHRFGGAPMHRNARPLEWAIVGGESGAEARPMPKRLDLEIMLGRMTTHTAIFVKQLSQADHPKSFKDFDTFPTYARIREFPKL